jgi:hypothetical protein
MPPASALVALVRSVYSQASGVSAGSPAPAPPVSKAAPPIRPVGGGRAAAPAANPEDMEFGPDYVAAMNTRDAQQRAARYGVGA